MRHLPKAKKTEIIKSIHLLRQAVPDAKQRKRIYSSLSPADVLERRELFKKTGLIKIGKGKFMEEKRLDAWGKFARTWFDKKGNIIPSETLKKETIPAIIKKRKTAAP